MNNQIVTLQSNAISERIDTLTLDVSPTTLGLLSGEIKALTISNQAELDEAADQLRRVATMSKTLEAKRKEITKPLDDEKKKVMDAVRPYTDGFSTAERILKASIGAYTMKLEEERRIAEAKAEEARRKEAEKLEAKAEKLEVSGKEEMAEALRMQAATTVVASIAPIESSKPAGISTRMVYGAVIVDPQAVIHAAVASQILAKGGYNAEKIMAYLVEMAGKNVLSQAAIVDEKFVNSMASKLKENMDWAGVKIEAKPVVSARSI